MRGLCGAVLWWGRRGAIWSWGLILLLLSGDVAAEPPLLGYGDVTFLVKAGLIRPDPARVRSVLSAAASRIAAEKIALERIYVASAPAMECALERATVRRSNIVQLFTEDVFLANQGFSVLFDAEALATSAKAFEFHSAFPVTTKLRNGVTAKMTFLLAGQGKLVIGYDRGGTYDHPDREYAVKIWPFGTFTGYDLSPYIRMDIARDNSGHRILAGLKVAQSPQASLSDFKGPGDFSIDGLRVEGPSIIASALRDTKITPRPIGERGSDPDRPSRLARLGCPPQGAWKMPTSLPTASLGASAPPPTGSGGVSR